MQTTIQYIQNELRPLYPASEVEGFIHLMLEKIYNITYTERMLEPQRILDPAKNELLRSTIERLKKYEPIQYILGEADFYNLTLKVAPGVLIPRPETEELVDWMVKSDIPEKAKIMGTGSGCIPLALKSVLPFAEISGVDISEQALEVARNNEANLHLRVEFEQADILNWEKYVWAPLDVVVSNPPYVREMEKEEMENNVLEFEPHTALFVSNDDPLLFYRAIAGFSARYLKPGGTLFFEINEAFENEMKSLVASFGFQEIVVRKDINGKARMLRCRR